MPLDISVLLFISGAPGGGEILVVFLVILVLFGPKRLPEVARSVGRVLEELRKASQDFKDQIMSIDIVEDDEPLENDWGASRVAPDATQARDVSPEPDCPEDAARMAAEAESDDLDHENIGDDDVADVEPEVDDELRND